jgi:hypothetical protein
LDERLSLPGFCQPELVRRAQHHQYGNDWTARLRSALFPRVTYHTAHVGAPHRSFPLWSKTPRLGRVTSTRSVFIPSHLTARPRL